MCGLSLGGGVKAVLGGKTWARRASFICCQVSALRREGKRAGARPEVSLLPADRFWGVAESRQEDQCVFFATLIALK